MKNLAAAVIEVMKSVKGMEKNSKVGSGSYAYSGTKDQDVKEVFNDAMAKHGLCILPISIDSKTKIDRWSENNKTKQSVFTEVETKYLLLHESGESQELAGYGHGVDLQDKSAGKATTYALKNTLLYAFLTPVGKIDDTDKTHSQDIDVPLSQLDIAIAAIEGCKNIADLETTWNEHSQFHNDKLFISVTNKTKKELS